MRIGIMQPYFMPYIGYFQLMKAVDLYVVYDDVNYIKGGWVNRNNIIANKEKQLFSITLKGASPNKLFNEIEIGDDFKKLTRTLEINYSKSPYYKETRKLLDEIFSYPNKQLSIFLTNSFEQILKYLEIKTEILLSSGLNKNNELKGQGKVIDICKNLGATTYINAIGGKELYSKEEFTHNGINLSFINTILSPYPQQHKEFIPGLSIIDVLMNNSPQDINILLDNYKLV